MRRTRTSLALALAVAASLLPGCYAARGAFGSEPSSLAYSTRWFGRSVEDQLTRLGDNLAGAPSALGSHCAECWKNITTDPRDDAR